MTPTMLPISPWPRSCQPSTVATLRPASLNTCGNQMSERGISGNSSFRGGQFFIGGGIGDGDIAAVGIVRRSGRTRGRGAAGNARSLDFEREGNRRGERRRRAIGRRELIGSILRDGGGGASDDSGG